MSADKISELQCRDTTLALTLLILIVWLFIRENVIIYAAMGLLVAGMTVPSLMRLPARLWFGFSSVLGNIMSRIILSLIFFIIVMPVALVRRLLGKDSLGLKNWRRDADSAFVLRKHTFSATDLHKPY